MKRLLLVVALSVSFAVPSLGANARQDTIQRLDWSKEVLRAIMDAPDKGIPEEVFNDAKCIAIVPHLVKGGFILGGKHGRGVATCRTGKGWSAPAFLSVGGGNFGLQIGLQQVDLIMLIMNDKGMQQLLSSKFQIGADASAAAGPVGRHASAGTDWKLDTEILTYSRARGAFAGLTLEGAVVQPDDDSTVAAYGRRVSFSSELTGQTPTPAIAQPFIAQVSSSHYKAVRENAKESK